MWARIGFSLMAVWSLGWVGVTAWMMIEVWGNYLAIAMNIAIYVVIWGVGIRGLSFFFPEEKERHRRGAKTGKIKKRSKRKPRLETELEIMGEPIQQHAECQHFLFTGATGTGKTQAINKFLSVIRKRNAPALIADAGGGFFSRFSNDTDLLFNPFDVRSVRWSPFAEIKAPYDCQRIAAAVIPTATGSGAEWNTYARNFLAETMLALHSQGVSSVKQLLSVLTMAEVEKLRELLDGTPAVVLAADGNERMLSATRAIIGTYLAAWRYLPDEWDFSFREWIKTENRGWMFVTYRDDQAEYLRRLVGTIFDLAITETLSLSEDASRELWFVLDEVDTLGKVSALRAGLTKLRKYGGRMVLGLQTVSQLRETYGRDEAQTLISNTATKLILRAGDNETADFLARELGEHEIERTLESQSKNRQGITNGGGTSSGTTKSQQILRQNLIMASELMDLPDLHGFLKTPPYVVKSGALEFEALPQIVEPFIEASSET